MKIVVIDGITLNPGDLSWEFLNETGDVQIFDRTEPGEVVDRCMDADIVLTNKISFDRQILESLPNLKLINVTATGYNIIDVDAAREKGVKVCNVPDYGTESVAQHTFALILELTNQAGLHSRSVSEGRWAASPDFAYALTPLTELKNKTIGLIGFGNIGRQTARIAKAFGMNVLYHTPRRKDTSLAEYAGLDSLLRQSDIVSLHLPLTNSNRGFVNKEQLEKMKDTALLINTARGQLVNEADLAEALNNGKIAGAATDVLSEEPPVAGNPLIGAKNCIITPHNAWMSREARQRVLEITSDNLRGFLEGKEINVVN